MRDFIELPVLRKGWIGKLEHMGKAIDYRINSKFTRKCLLHPLFLSFPLKTLMVISYKVLKSVKTGKI